MNYTLGKNMGIVGAYDEFNLANNYGALAADRRHVFNAAYSLELPNPIKGSNLIAKGLVNGWHSRASRSAERRQPHSQHSRFVQYRLQRRYAHQRSNGQLEHGLGNPLDRGSPVLTCDPAGDGSNQKYINQSCFAVPKTPGQSGPFVMPRVTGPAFFNSDLGLYKNFNISESKKIQFRFNAYNFLNHPLWSFISGSANTKLVYNPTTASFNNALFGTATEKQGRRFVMLTLKFYF